MTTRAIWTVALVAALCWPLHGAAQAQAPPPRDPGGAAAGSQEAAPLASVRGRVVAADSDAPLRRASVSLRTTTDGKGFGTMTDDAGVFAFEGYPRAGIG